MLASTWHNGARMQIKTGFTMVVMKRLYTTVAKQLNTGINKKKLITTKSIDVECNFIPNDQAMLQALRLVLDIPKRPIVLDDNRERK